MFKKSFYLIAVLSASAFAACHSGPTKINSTYHSPEPPVKSANSMKKEAAETNSMTNSTNNSMMPEHADSVPSQHSEANSAMRENTNRP